MVYSLESGVYAQIAGLVVRATHRGQGIGTELVQTAQAWAKERRMKRIRVRTNVERTRTHRFYERFNFLLLKTTRVYEKWF